MSINFIKAKESDIELIKPFIENDPYKPFGQYKGIKEILLNRYLLKEVKNILTFPENNAVFLAEENGKILGLISIRMLNWESKHFGMKMARIENLIVIEGTNQFKLNIKQLLLKKLFQFCEEKKIKHLSVKPNCGDSITVYALEMEGFKVMDCIVTYVFRVRKHKLTEIKQLYKVRPFKEEEIDDLVNLGKGVFSFTRYYVDESLPNEKCESLYTEWIRNSCKRTWADEVLVAEKKGQPVGFMTCKIHKDLNKMINLKIGSLVLSAVSPQGAGAYVQLVKSGLEWLSDKVDLVEMDTQINNCPVLKVWNKLGIEISTSRYSLHKSLGGSDKL